MHRAKKVTLGLLAFAVLCAAYALVGGILLGATIEMYPEKRGNRIYNTFVARCRYLHAWGIAERKVALSEVRRIDDPACNRLGWY